MLRRRGSSGPARSGSAFALVLGISFLCAASCIALIDKDADQCQIDGDCAAKGPAFAGRVCVQHVCVGASGLDSSTDAPTIDSGTDARETAIIDAPDVGTDGDSKAETGDSTAGVFVVAGTTLAGGVLVAIDPDTGVELKRESMTVSAIAYDPGLVSGGGDVWYLFEDSTTALDGGLAASKLHARRFDPSTKAWTELASIDGVPRPKSARDVVVMNKRLVYLAPYVGSDPLGVGLLYLIDIGVPTAPTLVCDGCLPGPANVVTKSASTDSYLGLAGARATDTFTGGIVGVAFVQACTDTGGTCPTYFERFRYTGNDGKDIPGNQAPFGSFTTDVTVGIGTSYLDKTAFMVVPDTTTTGKLLQNPQTFFGTAEPVGTFTFSGRPTFSPVAIDGCDQVALFTTFSNKLHAVPYGTKGFVATSIEGESASQTAFDVRSRIVAYIANGLKAARVSTTPALSLSPVDWPAIDYVPTAIKGREPANGCTK